MEFSPPAVPAERFVAPSHSEPLNQPWGQATPKGTETASLIVLETSLQPCLSLPHLFIILENFHLWTLWDWAVSGDCGEVEGKGEHCSMAVLGCAGTLARGSWGQALWEHNLSWRTEKDTGTGASPALDQPPQATRCSTNPDEAM